MMDACQLPEFRRPVILQQALRSILQQQQCGEPCLGGSEYYEGKQVV
jgi:hypothetical protein